ncbi:Importin beta-like protein [Tolypocladium ophioglossoides CBS 100239]|uniref:Importin beta-like protein n=1 Tax=Tolypocladium ophioglossoides (strain CBS 100239) TaxID=1163406 RepID=A0A0L0NEZ5_TOLOC|nr:Importin beta-like protein [Tolypocladium ophioglossoides CBS 100239]
MQDQPLHLSLDQVESPNPPDVIATTQATLSRFQSSPQAWSMVRHLLERPDEKVKFFGALTVIIKLNKESFSLSDEDAAELLVRLVGWYLESLSQPSGPLVSRKLASAIATFFLHFHRLWPRYLCHLIVCLASRQSCRLGAIDDSIDTTAALASLDPAQLQAALWVATSVMEDVGRFDLNTANNIGLYDVVLQNTSDAVALMARCLSAQTSLPAAHGDSIKCLQSWVWFSQRVSSGESHVASSLKPLVEAVIASLSRENSFDASVELLVDVLSNYPSLMTETHYENLASLFVAPWAEVRYQTLLQSDSEFESFKFGQLLLAFGEAKTEALMQSSDCRSQRLLSMLCGLLAADGYPVAEDRIFVSAVEFWSTFAETMADFVHGGEDEASTPWAPSAMSHVLEAVSNAWLKITYPPSEVLNQWDSNDRVGFSDARKDVVDLLQSAYTLAGPRLVVTFADLTLTALSSSAWLPLEAAAFCLGGLADCGRDDARFDDALKPVFASPLFSVLRVSNADVLLRTRQTCLSLIEHYTEYFERNVSFLAPALRLLFTVLCEPSMAASASKSILRLCSSCRHHLHPETGGFLDEYKAIASGKQLDCISSEKVLGAIACVSQAIPDPDQRHDACARILEFIRSDVHRARELVASSGSSQSPCIGLRCSDNNTDEHPGLHVGLRALRCLVSVGKGFQSPTDSAIDLDAGDNQQQQNSSHGLDPLHEQVMSIILELEGTFGGNSEVTELICSVLRTGFSESGPGPFVLRPDAVAHYLTSHTGEATRVGLLVSTASSFTSSLHSHGSHNRRTIFSALLLWVLGLLKQLPEPEYDPELTQNGIDFASRLLAKTAATVLGLQPADAAEFLFMFTIQVLDGKEPLPKGAAADFWCTFVGLTGDDQELQRAIKYAMETLGPLLAQSLARNIGGNASRSELDKLSEPVKKLVSRHPMAKEWLQSGLNHPSFPSDKVSPEQKSLFVKKVISLRGSRATNQVIREFWLSARGSSFAYVS